MVKYKTILADPPWEFNDKLDDTRKKPYKTMNIENLLRLRVDLISNENSHLYLWTPSAHIGTALRMIDKWGFEYKCHIVWLKRTKYNKIHFGMGHYFRHCNELCLFGVKGNLKLKTKNTRNLIDCKKPECHHSSKPPKMYELIEANSYPPYIELFATQKRDEWDSLGFEINGEDIRDEIDKIIKKTI